MAGFRSAGDTIRADYARMEAKLRGELRKEMNAELCEYASSRAQASHSPDLLQLAFLAAATQRCGGP